MRIQRLVVHSMHNRHRTRGEIGLQRHERGALTLRGVTRGVQSPADELRKPTPVSVPPETVPAVTRGRSAREQAREAACRD